MHPGYLIKATRQELINIGIVSSSTLDWLLGSKTKKVTERITTQDGIMCSLYNPESPTHLVWVFEDMLVNAL